MRESNVRHFVREPGHLQFSGSKITQRVFDFLSAAIGLVAISPVLVVLAAAIKFQDGGPVFYRATRVGKEGRLFKLYKFRSMTPDAERRGEGITVHNDARVTLVGKLLRRYKLDELPQLINVVRGEMSLVGPRPEDPRYVELYTSEQRRVLSVRPGITSVASLQFKNEESLLRGSEWQRVYVEDILPKKLAMELEYIPQRSFSKDLKIVFRTLWGITK